MLPAQLIAWRKAGDMSRETAAKLLGCSSKSLERYERGQSPIPEKIAAATLSVGNPVAGVELAPPHDMANYATWDNPMRAPRLWNPGKKHGSWERLPAGAPMHPVGTDWSRKLSTQSADALTEWRKANPDAAQALDSYEDD